MTRRRATALGTAALLALAIALAGCTADVPEQSGLSDEERAALASLGYVETGAVAAGEDGDHGHRVIVLGIDGMDWLISSRMMDEGRLPHFKALADAGGFRPLLSSIPPQSPVAWSNFITGTDPGGHGIFDFMHRKTESYLPYLSTSEVAAPPEKARILGIPVRNRFALPFTDYVFPVAGGGTLNLRRGVAFWQILEAAGIPCTIFKLPANFPPVPSEKGLTRSISGLGTPDILGTYGTFGYYTTEEWEGRTDLGGGYVYEVDLEDDVIRSKLYGPPNDFKDYEKIEERRGSRVPYSEKKVGIDFEVYVDPENPVAKIVVDDTETVLAEGEFSDWVELEFKMVPGVVTVSGIARFFLKSVHPEFGLYVSPVQINPANQALPITEPPGYGKELVDELGYFYTQGMAEDTKALEHGIFGNAEFAQQAKIVLAERSKAYDYELERFDEGLLYFYFSSLDQSTHAMWRCMDPSHPAYVAETDAAFADFIELLYMEFDRVLEKTLEKVDENTTLIVLSDHGFAPWYRAFHLNRWLLDEGYLVLKDGVDPDRVEWLLGVDWSKTRAYGLGINGLYVNLKGRESQGIVQPGPEADALVDEIAGKLETVRDPKTNQRVVVRAYKARETYHGPYVEAAPDIIVGYGWGYRGSDQTASGQIRPEILEDNTNKWSGDHCADYHHVPGVLFSNRPIELEHPALFDLAPTILAEFGIGKMPWMVGRPVF